MGLLPDTQNCGCACAGNAGNVFPVTAGERSRHASRHVRHARAVMHAGIANQRFHLKSAAGENVPGIPGACATGNFTYLVRGPYYSVDQLKSARASKHGQLALFEHAISLSLLSKYGRPDKKSLKRFVRTGHGAIFIMILKGWMCIMQVFVYKISSHWIPCVPGWKGNSLVFRLAVIGQVGTSTWHFKRICWCYQLLWAI